MLPFPFSSQPSMAALSVPVAPIPVRSQCPRQQPSLAAKITSPIRDNQIGTRMVPPPKQGDRGGLLIFEYLGEP